MIFALSMVVSISCVLWPVQFMTHDHNTRLFCNVFFAGMWLLLASAYVYRECFSFNGRSCVRFARQNEHRQRGLNEGVV
jgi:hypothetical protein